jgi:uncharacterized membrane protein YkgB
MKIKDSWNLLFERIERINVIPLARMSLFLIYFWFGAVKLLGLSQATPLARALTESTIGGQFFATSFMILAVIECVIGLLFLIPKLTRITVVLALLHMLVVCSPLLLVPVLSWQAFMIPTIEGQYIIKNLALVSLMLVVLTSSVDKQKS